MAGTYLDSRSPRARIAAAGRSADDDGLGASFVDRCYDYTPPSLSHQSASSSCPSTRFGCPRRPWLPLLPLRYWSSTSSPTQHGLLLSLALSAGRPAAYFASQPLPATPPLSAPPAATALAPSTQHTPCHHQTSIELTDTHCSPHCPAAPAFHRRNWAPLVPASTAPKTLLSGLQANPHSLMVTLLAFSFACGIRPSCSSSHDASYATAALGRLALQHQLPSLSNVSRLCSRVARSPAVSALPIPPHPSIFFPRYSYTMPSTHLLPFVALLSAFIAHHPISSSFYSILNPNLIYLLFLSVSRYTLLS
ncbi:hypothetical protein R3P38DRAFT_3254503 [Favolaschia claudopus]|uniref:Uncharacterized protein n=1 Tax=Favolaschia claudopus TaxID=2862362 RepID=A0AAW0DS46_9AGAR